MQNRPTGTLKCGLNGDSNSFSVSLADAKPVMMPIRDVDRLPNGNVLIAGYPFIIEVTRDGKSSGSFNMQIWNQLSKAGQVQTKDLLMGFTKLRELVSLNNIIAIADILPTNSQ